MHLISKNSWNSVLLLTYVRKTSTSYPDLYYSPYSLVLIVGIGEFEVAVAYALENVDQLKPEQKASIKAVFDGRDVFIWLPTGFGKSICYTYYRSRA